MRRRRAPAAARHWLTTRSRRTLKAHHEKARWWGVKLAVLLRYAHAVHARVSSVVAPRLRFGQWSHAVGVRLGGIDWCRYAHLAPWRPRCAAAPRCSPSTAFRKLPGGPVGDRRDPRGRSGKVVTSASPPSSVTVSSRSIRLAPVSRFAKSRGSLPADVWSKRDWLGADDGDRRCRRRPLLHNGCANSIKLARHPVTSNVDRNS